MISKALFGMATATLAYGVFQNFKLDGVIASTGTMSMNSFYLLAIALFTASAAAKLVFEMPQRFME